MAVLEVADLHVRYGEVEAVGGVSFSVDDGEVFGLLGPNGAGKTSILEVCEGYRAASDGRVRVLGRDPTGRALFLSGTFLPINPNSVIANIANIADIFPIRHFNQAVFSAFDPRLPHGPAHGFAWSDVGVMALWAIGATLIGVRRFRWEPRR